MEMKPFLLVAYGFGEGDKEKLQKEVGEPARDKFYGILERILQVANIFQLKSNEIVDYLFIFRKTVRMVISWAILSLGSISLLPIM